MVRSVSGLESLRSLGICWDPLAYFAYYAFGNHGHSVAEFRPNRHWPAAGISGSGGSGAQSKWNVGTVMAMTGIVQPITRLI